jgi:hypothetical protein
VDATTVLRTWHHAWHHDRVQPCLAEIFKFSTVPELIAKVTDAVGVYVNQPDNTIVLSVDVVAL